MRCFMKRSFRLRNSNKMTSKRYEKVTVDNWGQPWDCPKTQYGNSCFNLNRDCPKGCPLFCMNAKAGSDIGEFITMN